MIPAPSYNSICDGLSYKFVEKRRHYDNTYSGDNILKSMRSYQSYDDIEKQETTYNTQKAILVGILFIQPSHKIAKEEVLPNITYYHVRSGKNVNFYLAGYGAYWNHIRDAEVVCSVDGTEWQYSSNLFNNLRMDIEARSRWQYSGECDLIILNAIYSESKKKVILDYSCCVAININDLLRASVFPSTMKLFESIFRYAEDQDNEDPTWGLSDKLGAGSAKEGFKNIIIKIIPHDIGKEVEKVSKLAVRDISKDQ